MWKYLLLPLLAAAALAAEEHPTLALRSQAPSFSLPGVDGKIHRLADYDADKVLVVIFTCNHCPIAQMYESRIAQLVADFGGKSVGIVTIQPNDPKAIRVDELDSSDLSDSLAEMKIRAAYKHIDYPYLYDGDTQSVARAYGPKATPHVFIFDQRRRLRYEGRFDDNYRSELVKIRDARNAIEALLANQPVLVEHRGVFGCSTKWKYKEQSRLDRQKKIEEEPVTLDVATAADLRKLRSNPTGKLLLVNFWSAGCGACTRELQPLETTYQMYRQRDFDLVLVSTDARDRQADVMRIIRGEHASNRNLIVSSGDTAALRATFDPAWEAGAPYTVLLSPDGRILFEKRGELDMLKLRRTILANMPGEYAGFQKYWVVQ
jgi:peroxiredoxin